MTKLVLVEDPKTERVEQEDDTPKVGEWYWISYTNSKKTAEDKSDDDEIEEDAYEVATSGYDHKHRYDEPGKRWLACVVHIGSNYAKVEGVYLSDRISLEMFHKWCTRELDPGAYVKRRIGAAQTNVRGLLDEIQRITALLGVAPREQLAEVGQEGSSALAIAHGTADIDDHKKALVKAKEKTLPDLFKKVEEQHGMMATWMKADLIPAKADLTRMKTSIERIDDRIHTVELYAGLEETLSLVRKGKPGANDAKVHIMQRMAFMDEECLANYEAGGMTFKGIKAFDMWLARDDNFRRLLPHERSIIAFRVRRNRKDYDGGDSLRAFITFMLEEKFDMWTFLYIRNGEQLWRMHTSIEFEEELFPDQQQNGLIGDAELWISQHEHGDDRYITSHQRDGLIAEFGTETAKHEARKKKYKIDKAAWDAVELTFVEERKLCKKHYRDYSGIEDEARREAFKIHDRAEPNDPSWHHASDSWKHYEKLSPDHLYYDDAMKHIARIAFEHNRIAVIIQGLLDRSKCLQPHPPWRIWTAEGFMAGIELVYDATRVITSGDVVDFEAYREQLNKSLKVGCVTYGQQGAWKRHMADKFARSARRAYERYDRTWYHDANSNPGPGRVAKVTRLTGKGASYAWLKETSRARRVPSRPGWTKLDRDFKVKTGWTCPIDELFNVTAYTPGDFHMFYDDPRTRADYIRWAPYLLSAEDFYAGKLKLAKPDDVDAEPPEEPEDDPDENEPSVDDADDDDDLDDSDDDEDADDDSDEETDDD